MILVPTEMAETLSSIATVAACNVIAAIVAFALVRTSRAFLVAIAPASLWWCSTAFTNALRDASVCERIITEHGLVYLLAFLVLSTFPVLGALGGLWARTRQARASALEWQGQCPDCGYDLRSSDDRCPECGHASEGPCFFVLQRMA